jgi:hypothetical protein
MSSYFSKLIKAGGQIREFNFKLASLNDDSRYIVDVPDDKGGRIMFSIYKNSDQQWHIAAQLMPLWIHETENVLGEAIEENKESELLRRSNEPVNNPPANLWRG